MTHETDGDDQDDATQGLARDHARRIVEALRETGDIPKGLGRELTPDEEDKVESALVDLGAAEPENTTMAERDESEQS